MQKIFKGLIFILVLTLSMTSMCFAEVKESNNTVNAAAGVTLIDYGSNYQVYLGVPSDYANLNWSSYANKPATINFTDWTKIAYSVAGIIKDRGIGGIFGGLGLAFLVDDLNQAGSDALYQRVYNKAPVIDGHKTSYFRVYESHATVGGYHQYSRLYVNFYEDNTYKKQVGTTDVLCMYSWASPGRSVEK